MKNTGLLLSEIKGPLDNLLDNLSGKQGKYWLTALKKMLRQEEIPEPPAEVIKALNALNSRKRAKDKLQKVIDYLRTIPVIHEVTICEKDEGMDILNIDVLPNLMAFIHGKTKQDTVLFNLKDDHTIERVGGSADIDATFNTFCYGSYENLTDFCKAMIELGEKYEEFIPTI